MVLGAVNLFGAESFIVGFVLVACGLLGLPAFIGAAGALRPGAAASRIEERHYIGKQDGWDRLQR